MSKKGNPLNYPLKQSLHGDVRKYPIYDSEGKITYIYGLQGDRNPRKYPLKDKNGKIIGIRGLQAESLRYDMGGDSGRYKKVTKKVTKTKK